MINKSIRLDCDLPVSDPPEVKWVDFVYNTDPEPAQIFSSFNNTDELQVNMDHPNWTRYEVDPDFTLTINLLQIDDDPGEYMCTSLYNGSLLLLSYDVTIAGSVSSYDVTVANSVLCYVLTDN